MQNHESLFFENLKKHFYRYEPYTLDFEFIPKGGSSRLTRYFRHFDGLWFSRSEINDLESVYYFGFGEKPNFIITYYENKRKSNILFYKGSVFIKNLKCFSIIGFSSFNIKIIDSETYINLGRLDSGDFIGNLEKLAERADNSREFSKMLYFRRKRESKDYSGNKKTKTVKEYGNGYEVQEGMDLDGRKRRRGSLRKNSGGWGDHILGGI